MAAKLGVYSHSVVAILFRMFIALWIDDNCLIERLCNVVSTTTVTHGGKLTKTLEMQTQVVTIWFFLHVSATFLIDIFH